MELLAEYGVDFAQGYYLGRPEPLADALARGDDGAGPEPHPMRTL
jgi:EAL domain-containing protein (putative c-di-GMP-specific phosphodiesterase class I)